jgi:flagellin
VSLRINTNIPAMHALANLSRTNAEMEGSITRLSSGLRINSAADDPAGLIISEGMRAQIKGLDQAIRNSQDAISMAKTAEAAMDEVQKLLRDIRGLAVSSANTAVADASVLQANQTQIRSTIASINRIAEQTQFGSKKLLNGTAGALANVTSTANVDSIYMGGTFNGETVASGPVTIDRVTQGTRAQIPLGNTFASPNTVVTTAGSFVINGYSFTSTGTETLSSLAAKINEMSATTGVTAEITGSGPYSISLTQTNYGANHRIDFFDPSNVLHNAASAASQGVNAVFNVSVTTDNGVQTIPFTGGQGPKESGLRLSDSDGNTILVNENGNANISSPTQVGVVTVGSVRFQIGAFANQSVAFSMPTVFAQNLGTGVVPNGSIATLDVTTQQGAYDAMKIIDSAISQLAMQRGELGSFQKNFLESTARSLDIAKENLTSTESQIRDADMAQEITEYTRLQILQQSGMSVLAQANQQPQQVLKLLQ